MEAEPSGPPLPPRGGAAALAAAAASCWPWCAHHLQAAATGAPRLEGEVAAGGLLGALIAWRRARCALGAGEEAVTASFVVECALRLLLADAVASLPAESDWQQRLMGDLWEQQPLLPPKGGLAPPANLAAVQMELEAADAAWRQEVPSSTLAWRISFAALLARPGEGDQPPLRLLAQGATLDAASRARAEWGSHVRCWAGSGMALPLPPAETVAAVTAWAARTIVGARLDEDAVEELRDALRTARLGPLSERGPEESASAAVARLEESRATAVAAEVAAASAAPLSAPALADREAALLWLVDRAMRQAHQLAWRRLFVVGADQPAALALAASKRYMADRMREPPPLLQRHDGGWAVLVRQRNGAVGRPPLAAALVPDVETAVATWAHYTLHSLRGVVAPGRSVEPTLRALLAC